ncbi:MAG: sugar ABC transporter substrate-binding protein [Anaerolineaceae bacterium]|nr:sugar ABC transporter substrate-binding protein [Anaerolineaceae bacterium]
MKVLKNLIALVATLVMVVTMVGCAAPAATVVPTTVTKPTTAPTTAPSVGKKIYKIGYIQYSSDAYYQNQADAAKLVEKYINENEKDWGIEMTFVTSEGKPETELANIEDFIAKKMDAVIDFTGAAATAQQGAQEANKANIPFFVVGSTAADGPGKVTSTIKGDFVEMGGKIGKYLADNYPNAKIAIVEGTLGQGIVEYFEEGFQKNLGPNNKIVIKAPSDWNAEKSQNIMNDWLANYHGEFDMVYAMNADIYLGVVRALKDAGKLNNPIKVITHNGRPEDAKGVADGDAIATLANSPTYESGVLLKVVTTFLQGGQVPPLVITPSVLVDKTNPQALLGWELDKGVKAFQEYVITAGATTAPTTAPSVGKKIYKIGYIQYSSDAYYQNQADAAKLVEKYINENEKDWGIEMTFVTSEGKPETELANIEDFIAKKMDAVIDFTGAAATAQQGAQEANKANIPFFVVGSTAADGPGKVTSTIKGDFVEMGGKIGKYLADNYPNAKIAIVEGTLGQGIVEYFEEGFQKNLGPNNKIVIKAPSDWNAEKSQNIMNDWLANYHGEFDMVYAMNADIYLGVVRALKDAGKLNNPIKVITHNGRPEDAKGVADGDAIATLANSPTYESGVLLKVVTTFLQGGQVPPLVITPSVLVDKTNPQALLGWELDKGVKAFQEFKIQ